MDASDLNLPWLESPFFEKLLSRSNLDLETRALVRTYANDGFLVFDPEDSDFSETMRSRRPSWKPAGSAPTIRSV